MASTIRVDNIAPLTGTTVTVDGSLNVATASFALTASRANTATTATSSVSATTATSASFATTASYALNGGGGGGGVVYTSYVASISGSGGTPSVNVISNTTGLTPTWANGNADFYPAFYYTSTIAAAAAKIVVFISGKAVLASGKGNTYIPPNTSYVITSTGASTSTLDLWYDTATSGTEGTQVTVEVRIYP